MEALSVIGVLYHENVYPINDLVGEAFFVKSYVGRDVTKFLWSSIGVELHVMFSQSFFFFSFRFFFEIILDFFFQCG